MHGAAHCLDYLIAPHEAAYFFAQYQGRAPLHCQGFAADRFAPLVSLDDLDRHLDTSDLRQGMVSLARRGRMIDPAQFVGALGRVIPSAVAEAYLNGATVIFQHLHDALGSLADLCRCLEQVFRAHIQTNIYLTPPGEQGFAPHADNHDLFVLQVTGSKEWRLGESTEVKTLNLRPGDTLYLPRGLVHEAKTVGAGPSLHITIGIIAKNWADLLTAAVQELARENPELLQPLPLHFDHGDQAVAEKILSFANQMAEPATVSRALRRLRTDFLNDRRPQVTGLLTEAYKVAGSRHFRRRAWVQWLIEEDGNGLTLSGPGGDLRLSGTDADALTIALSGSPFEPEALPTADPERLVRKLWVNGLVEAVD